MQETSAALQPHYRITAEASPYHKGIFLDNQGMLAGLGGTAETLQNP
jgi:hypothetical protein